MVFKWEKHIPCAAEQNQPRENRRDLVTRPRLGSVAGTDRQCLPPFVCPAPPRAPWVSWSVQQQRPCPH